jgi:hypothetical protein
MAFPRPTGCALTILIVLVAGTLVLRFFVAGPDLEKQRARSTVRHPDRYPA